MLPRKLRLPRSGFSDAQKHARVSSTHLSVTYKKNASPEGFAVVVSKKVAPLSVKRHLLKRRILSVVRAWSEKEFACIVYARAGADKLSYTALKTELADLKKRITVS